MSDIIYNIDRLMIRNDFWMISGWAVCTKTEIQSAEIFFTNDRRSVSQKVTYGEYREDVSARFKRSDYALNSGIFGLGPTPLKSFKMIELVVTFADGTETRLDITGYANPVSRILGRFRLRGKMAAHLLRRGRFAELWQRTARICARTARKAILKLQRQAPNPVLNSEGAVLILDHAMGGGANAFSARLIQDMAERGRAVYILRFSVSELRFTIEKVGGQSGKLGMSYVAGNKALKWLRCSNFAEIHVNNLVSLPYIKNILDQLIEKSSNKNCVLKFYFHDFHSLCPSFTLMDYQDKFCGVPSVGLCNKHCMKEHQAALFLFAGADDLAVWRTNWRAFLDQCDEIRFFSHSSYEIFRSVHKTIDESRILVAPHDDAYTTVLKSPALIEQPIPTIGIFGTIDEAKGARVVEQLVDYIEANQIRARVVVFGSIAANIGRKFVHVTGPYKLTNLKKLVEQFSPTVCLMPSIWPETFSFVLSEGMALGLPIVAFDLGAQRERLAARDDTRLISPQATPAEIFDALNELSTHRRTVGLLSPAAAPRICAFTSASTNYVAKACALAKSLKKHHPEMEVFYGLSDLKNIDVDYKRGVFDDVISVMDLDIEDFQSWSFKHSIVELSTAIKPFIIKELLSRGYDKVYYFDPDIVVFSPLDDLFAATDETSVVLTPHQTQTETDYQAIIDNEICSLKHGVYNLGFIGVTNSAEGRRFANWWADRVYEWCVDDIPNGLFTDQKWIDLVPALFDRVNILRDSRFNVASWNVTQRLISGRLEEGGVTVDGEPLGFYHFTGFDSGAHRIMAEKNSRGNADLMRLVDWYARETSLAKSDPASALEWSFARYDNGEPILPEHRRIYRDRRDLQLEFPNPFSVHPNGGFARWLRMNNRNRILDLAS